MDVHSRPTYRRLVFLVSMFSCLVRDSQQQTHVLTPTYFNVAEGKLIQATATCGEGFPPPGERYCKLTGNTADVIRPGEQEIIQGQYCDYCEPNKSAKAHPIQHAIDGTEKWWQSPPLSRGIDFNEVNITIDLGQLYHIAYVIIKSANSPRPGQWILERSQDYGETYKAWQYFAESESECRDSFGMDSITKIVRDDDIICTSDYSNIVPLEDGEIVVSLVNGRPGANNFSYSETIQEWTKATNIRLRLMRTNTLLGHLMGLARQDPTVTRRYYYSIKDISVGGRCVCNGHADTCDTPGENGRQICTCSHNTCGSECEFCCPGFVQKKWKPATLEDPNECEKCNCHGHSDDCYYNEEVARSHRSLDMSGNYEGGGVCIDCQDHTAGINCELCEDGYYRQGDQDLDSPYVCEACDCDPYFSTGNCAPITGQCECRPQFTGPDCGECNEGYYDFPSCKPCDCSINGTLDKVCLPDGGQCPCKVNYAGQYCDRCGSGFFDFPSCFACDCDRRGSRGSSCDQETGQCRCRATYSGRTCDECESGFYSFPNCRACACSPYGVTEDICDKSSGDCLCRDNFDGTYCDRCTQGYFGYPECEECACDSMGSLFSDCTETGQCRCRTGFSGLKCDQCGDGYYRYPDCFDCDCSRSGSRSILCDELAGQCSCRHGYQGRTCDMCAEGFYNYPNCEECNCDPAGVIERPGQPTGRCGQTQGACTCKANVIGRACDSCAPLFYNLQRSNPDGCQSCDCNLAGTVSGLALCDETSGQCLCKGAVGGQQCQECRDGYYWLQAGNSFGCTSCGCDVGGSISHVCDKVTGQCICRPRVSGRTCGEPSQLHFFPSLHQHKFEFESGFTPNGRRPRIGYDSKEFPGFSYLGYAVMSSIQPVVLVSVDVDRQSIYRIVMRYLYDGDSPVTGRITVTPTLGDTGSEQSSNIVFVPGSEPQFVTVEGGGVIMPFVLNAGGWTVQVEAPEGVLLDYLVLLPSAFYEATVLIQSVADPCIPTTEQDRCNYYVFPTFENYDSVRGVDGLYYDINVRQFFRATPFADEYIRDQLDIMDLAHLDEDQDNLHLTMNIENPGEYVFVVEYYGGGPGQRMGSFTVDDGPNRMQGLINFYNCTYLCRSVVVSPEGDLQTFTIENDQISVVLQQIGDPFFLAVSSVIAIPVNDFDYDFITPSLECVRTASGECLESIHPIPPDSTLIDFVDPTGEEPKPPNMFIPTTTVRYITTPDGPTVVYVEIHLLPPGKYVFVVHYYQPENSGFDVTFRIPGEFDSEGTFKAGYCPHVSGCRVFVTFPDGTKEIDLTGLGSSIQLSIPGTDDHTVWIDYILAIPADKYSDNILNEIPSDRAGEFITYCGNNNFFVSEGVNISRWADSPELCKNAVFSISTEFNNGAISCDCDAEGSTEFECEVIGGQCSCRANVVGRQCDRCAIGYYDFPNCRRCRCPTGVCNEVTGACECPENVEGRRCDRCATATYGYDPLAGCVECDCDERGTLGSQDCNPVSGQCRCKPNVGGRQCDQCLPGFYQYPLCLPCDCDSAGTLPQICDQVTAQCLCKDNVIGEQCDQCPVGTFDLSEGNTQGCLSCFCFGVTDKCKSYNRRRSPIPFRDEWRVTNLKDPLIRYNGELVNVYVNGHGTLPSEAIYWIPPSNFFGNKLTSYGGRLSFRVRNDPKESRGDLAAAAQLIRRPDVVIGGNGITIIYSNLEQPDGDTSLTMDIKMTEENFQYSFSGRPVSREDFMMVIGNIDQFEIRAQYFDEIYDSSLSFVVFETTHQNGDGEVASSVERCRCPPEYTGLSCEQCAPGHYRIQRGTFLGQCVPCECNNHTNKCDEQTGYCLNCEDNTSGAQCQVCKTGYHGNALGTVPEDGCEICACPMPVEEHNYADSCGVDADGNQYCICLEGHVGKFCEMCADGYYGNPSRPNGQCQQCDCSGNSDPNLPGLECDSLYGTCLRCRADTTGDNCEDCADWYYGDAVNRKDCQPCDCDRYGSESCDRSTGQCECKPNVVGTRCDQCEANYYDFESGLGCRPCDCGPASRSSQCDPSTGVCSCRPGVEGTNCDRCSEGYYQYSRRGCRACSCSSNLRCDPETGECLCPQGAIGPNCDQCEDRYILTQDGCLPCDDCVHLLLDILEEMDFSIGANISFSSNVSVGLDTLERLKAINESIADIQNHTKAMESNNENVKPMIEDSSGDLDKLKKLAKRTLKSASRADGKSDKIGNKTAATLQLAKDLAAKIDDAFDKIRAQVENMSEPIPDQFGDFDNLLQRALEILEEIRGRNHSQMVNESAGELEMAKELLDRVLGLSNSSGGLVDRLLNVSMQVQNFRDKLAELMNLTATARDNVDSVNGTSSLPTDIKSFGDETTETYYYSEEETGDAEGLLEQAREYLADAEAALLVTGGNASALASAHDKLEARYGPLKDSLNFSRELVSNATAHAADLTAQADLLESLLVSTKELAENALNAASAYRDIVTAIEEAEKAALAAKNASGLAEEASNGFGSEPQKSLKKSRRLNAKGVKAIKRLGTLEADLNASSEAVSSAKEKNDGVEYDLSEIERGMMAIPSEDSECEIKVCGLNNDVCKPGFTGENCNVAKFADDAQDAKMQAMNASVRAEAAAEVIGAITNQLPFLEGLVTRDIPEGIADANENIDDLRPQIRKGERFSNQIHDLSQSLIDKHTIIVNISSNVLGKLDQLREQIDNARTLAQGIQIAAKLEDSSSLQLRSSQISDTPQSVTTLSMHFITNSSDALLFFAGGPGASDDYLALEIRQNDLNLKYNLGDDDVTIPLSLNVADGKWHEVEVERVGKKGKLVVYSDFEGAPMVENERRSEGTQSLLHWSPGWGIFIGGVGENFTAPAAINVNPFAGGIDKILFNQEPLSIWNFESANEVNQGIIRVDEASEEVSEDTNGFSFDGDGYVKLKNTRNWVEPFNFGLSVKTHAPNGLIFFGGKGTDYISIEMRGGRMMATLAIDGEKMKLTTKGKYNNKKWTSMNLRRSQGTVYLDVNEEDTGSESLSAELGTSAEFKRFKFLFFGGLVGIKDNKYPAVTRRGFNGCMKDVIVNRVAIDLLDNVKSKGIFPKCIKRDVQLVSFPAPHGGYVKMPPVNFFTSNEFIFRFRAHRPSGLLMYVSNVEHEDLLAMQLVNGTLVATLAKKTQNPGIVTLESQGQTYDDGEWHTVVISRTSNRDFHLEIDDAEESSVVFRIRSSMVTDGPFFIGGLPKSLTYNQNVVPDLQPFVGCISDVAMNDEVQNFADRIGDHSTFFGSCPDEALVLSEAPPVEEFASTTTSGPVSTAPSGECKLGFNGEAEADPDDTGAVYFGATSESRYEYETFGRAFIEEDEVTFSLKTAATHAVLYYTADDRQIDFTTLYLQDGYLVYSFNYGAQDLVVTASSARVNDNRWHKIKTTRDSFDGQIFVDGDLVASGVLGGNSRYLSTHTPLYVGGLPADLDINDIPEESRESLIGCMKDFQVFPKPRALLGEFEVPPCPGLREPGMFFDEHGGYVVLRDDFSVGLELSMTFDIKPRQSSGIIFSVQNPNMDFLALELRAGSLYLTVENGGGEFTASYTPPNGEFSLCNGQWHTVEVFKDHVTASLVVDGEQGEDGVSDSNSQQETNTNHPLYFGGVPDNEIHDGILDNRPFGGCIKNVVINGKPEPVADKEISGNVDLRSCPAN